MWARVQVRASRIVLVLMLICQMVIDWLSWPPADSLI